MCVAGTCRQGRARCARPELCSGHVDRDQSDSQSFPMARIDDLGHAVVLWLCVVVLCVMVPALVFRITWADALQMLAMIGVRDEPPHDIPPDGRAACAAVRLSLAGCGGCEDDETTATPPGSRSRRQARQ